MSPVELTEAALGRIDGSTASSTPLSLLAEQARAAGRAAEAEIAAGRYRGPLHGIPYRAEGHLRHRRHPHHRPLQAAAGPRADGGRRRRSQAARPPARSLIGKLATHEFAIGGPSFDLPWPPARNPWNPEHFTGGSSSGTGAAVAAGLVLGGIGTDTGGSIRGPAAFCGIAGIKPTYGLVSRARRPAAGLLAGPCRADDLDRRGLRASAAGDGRPRSGATRPAPTPGARLPRGARQATSRACASASSATSTTTDDRPTRRPRAASTTAAQTLASARRCGARGARCRRSPTGLPAASMIMMAEASAMHEPSCAAGFTDYGELFRDR